MQVDVNQRNGLRAGKALAKNDKMKNFNRLTATT